MYTGLIRSMAHIPVRNLSYHCILFALINFPDHLQYLDWSDLQKYVKAMVELLGHYASDSSYIRIFHHQHLKHNQADSKKDAA